MDPKKVPHDMKGPVPKAEDHSLFDMFLNSPLDNLPDVDLLQRPDMWEHMSLLKVLHDVYHATDEESFPPNEWPHWRFVNRLSAELVKVFTLKEKEVERRRRRFPKKTLRFHKNTSRWTFGEQGIFLSCTTILCVL
jgi:hypothetical protein